MSIASQNIYGSSPELEGALNKVQSEIVERYLDAYPDTRATYDELAAVQAEKNPPSDTVGRFLYDANCSLYEHPELERNVETPYESGGINFTRG